MACGQRADRMTAFPPELPPDLDDLDVIAGHDWSAFLALRHVDTHWQRPGWTPGRSSYHWMVTFTGCDAVHEHVAHSQRAVPTAYDRVEVESVHLTLGRVAFTDEVPEATALQAAQTAQRARPRPTAFEIRFGPLTGSRGAIRFSVGPWTPLLAVHTFLASVTREVLDGRCVMDTHQFRPHVSIAYAHSRIPVTDVAAGLREWRAVSGPTVQVTAVELVRLERVDRSYRHHTLERVPLLDAP